MALQDRFNARTTIDTAEGPLAIYRLGALAEFDHIITDDQPDARTAKTFRDAGLTLTIARKDEAAE
mgnify:CR=1 FL=1